VRRANILIVAVLAGAALAAITAWGCATTTAEGPQLDHPRESEPDGGWAAYRPSRREYDVDPGRIAAGAPSTSPVFSLGHDIH
jgi:hypothetical protein